MTDVLKKAMYAKDTIMKMFEDVVIAQVEVNSAVWSITSETSIKLYSVDFLHKSLQLHHWDDAADMFNPNP